MTAPSEEVQYWAYKVNKTRALYFRILFSLYEEDQLPLNYVAPHLRSPKADHE